MLVGEEIVVRGQGHFFCFCDQSHDWLRARRVNFPSETSNLGPFRLSKNVVGKGASLNVIFFVFGAWLCITHVRLLSYRDGRSQHPFSALVPCGNECAEVCTMGVLSTRALHS
jgi:hypothetical protein